MVISFDGQARMSPDQLAKEARQGDLASREKLILAYRPFILKTASRYCGRFIHEEDEEGSVALLAFNEAIDSFRPGQGAGFLSFARLVIERRLHDHFRSTKARRREIPFSGLSREDMDEGLLYAMEREAAERAFSEEEATRDRQEEIALFRSLLAQYNLSLDELVNLTPRHRDARRRAIQAAETIAADPKWRTYFKKYGELPLKDMDGRLPVSRKTLERQRKYIVALLLVFLEDLPYLREYLKGGVRL